MLCRNPFMKDGAAFPCGQCQPCRFNRRRMWAHRIMLEAFCHREKAFIGLSYSELYLPSLEPSIGRLPPTLRPKHLQDWLKRIRKKFPLKLRFYAVGEYGDQSWRPHYHVILYGYPTCVRGRTYREPGSSRPLAFRCCDHCAFLQATWPFGDVDLGSVTHHSASYCAEYTVKKMTALDDPRLKGRLPEFCRMSLRPGIGVDAMWNVAQDLVKFGLDESMADVPSALRHGSKEFPLGRYLRGILREMIGREKSAPPEALKAIQEELRPLRQAAFDASRSFKAALVESGNGRIAQIEAKNAIFKRSKSL